QGDRSTAGAPPAPWRSRCEGGAAGTGRRGDVVLRLVPPPGATQLVDLRDGTWEDAESWVGRELAQYQGADDVTVGDIRRRLEVLAWDCPLHYDEAVARQYGYRTVVSPATMLMTWAMPAYWAPGDPRPTLDDGALVP